MSANIIKHYSLDELRQLKGETDWKRLRKASDHQEDAEFDVDWSKVRLVEPEPKTPVSIRLDADVLNFFKAQGKGYQTRINAVLRAYVEAHERRR